MNAFPYVYDFVSVLLEDAELRRWVKSIVLFGSVSREDADDRSDIDLFIDTPGSHKAEVEKIVKESEKRFLIISGGRWKTMGMNLPINTTVGDLGSPRWKELRQEMASTGKTIYGKFESQPGNVNHSTLFNYSLAKLPQEKKMNFLRKVFGYRTRKDDKLYEHSGMLEDVGGKKIGKNAILVPVDRSLEAQKLFNSLGVTPEMLEIWMKS